MIRTPPCGVVTGWKHILDGAAADASRQAELTLMNELDSVWKALSDGTRRAILDYLRRVRAPPLEIVEAFPTSLASAS
ncbi:MAG: hypothetical protein U0Q16_12080 [Bryobacteraceae bacterium]